MTARIAILSALLLLTAAGVATTAHSAPLPPRSPFSEFPVTIGPWQSAAEEPLDRNVVAVLGVDDYVNRLYVADTTRYVGLYVGFYASQREGDTIHSPLNCLPGAGWQPVSNGLAQVPTPSGPLTVNRYVVQKGLERHVVLYWYQSHGRVVANEYWSKLYMMYDAFRLGRTDAALVRVISPIIGDAPGAEARATAHALDFVTTMFPVLDGYVPL